jgi:hypothetical protein
LIFCAWRLAWAYALQHVFVVGGGL